VDASLDLLVQVVELVLDLLLGLSADKPPQALTGVVVAQRDGADVALVDLEGYSDRPVEVQADDC
jgi:hypothetical protein